jgi:signal transduction histidine kinase
VDYPARPDGPLQYVTAFAERAPHEIWAGGAGGLVLIDRGHFRLIRPTGLDSFKDVTGVVDAGSEGLWLNATNGVIHISRDEADRALRDPNYRFQWERFDSFDGLPGQTPAIGRYTSTYPTAIEGMDGRIWFTASGGVAWVDPKKNQIVRNTLPPPVSITTVLVDGSRHLQFAHLRLPAHTASIQISYSALSLSVPERVRFRYKLEGSDDDWQEVGTRREAFYTNLGPRHYRFRVIACNQDGVWNDVGAFVEFTIAPAWYQTAWFRLCCVAALFLLLRAVYLFRIRQLEAQFAAGLEARIDERTRIARELHDTLLQSFQGAVFQFQAARKLLLRAADNAMQMVDEAIQAAEEGITEGRVAIQDLRPEAAAQRDLPELLNAAGHELASAQEPDGHPPSFNVIVEGRQQSLPPMLQDEVYRISREVVRNAFAHAVAGHIEVEIRYDQDQLRVRIRDDGKGIDPKFLEDGGRPGHWGISGMRERAQRIGAQLAFWSEVGAGAEVQLTVPGAIAYKKHRDGHRFRLFRRAGSDERRS